MALQRQCTYRTLIGLLGGYLLTVPVWANPDTTMTISPTATSGALITASDENSRNNTVSSAYNSHSHTDISQTASTLNIGVSSGGTSLTSTGVLTLEGSTVNDNEFVLQVTDPDADNTLTVNSNNLTATRTLVLPDANGIYMPTGALFFMVTGSCPAGSTDVTATYADRFVRINATGGTTAGADTHSHTADGTLATETHAHTGATGTPSNAAYLLGGGGTATPDNVHTHTISTQAALDVTGSTSTSNNIPAYVTAKACQVD